MLPQSQALRFQAGGFLSVNLLLLWSVALSWLFPWMTWMAAVPLVLLWHRQAPGMVKTVSVLAWSAGLFLLDRWLLFQFIVFGVGIATIVTLCFRGRIGLSGALAGLIAVTAALVGILWALKSSGIFDFTAEALKSWDQVTAAVAAETGAVKGRAEALALLDRARGTLVDWLQVYPGRTVFGLLLFFFVTNALMAGSMLRRDPVAPKPAFSFLDGRLDFAFVWLLIAAWAGLFISMELKNAPLKILCLNAVYILAACFLVQGFAVLASLLRRVTLPGWVKAGLAVSAFLVWPVIAAVMVGGFGLLDQWMHFRKIKLDFGGQE